VLNRSVIGAGSIVAAAALVAEGFIVPPASLIAGVPGVVKRSGIDPGRIQRAMRNYLHTAAEHRAGLRRIG